MVDFAYNDVKIRVVQGFGEVGGNCIVVESRDNRVVFDQGIRFSRFKRFYSHNVTPKGYSEMRKLKIIPDFEEPLNVYITHFHLDHIGLLHPLPNGSTVYVPDEKAFERFIEPYRATNNWTTYVSPPIGVDVLDASKNNDNVIPLKVEHSALPASAYYYNNGDVRILYTGDLRLSSPLTYLDQELHRKLHESTLLEEYEEKGLETDVLIIEGTNFSSRSVPITPAYFVEQLENLFKTYSSSLMIFSVDPLDAEAILSILEVSKLNDRIPALVGRRLTAMTKLWVDRTELKQQVYQLGTEELDFDVLDELEIEQSPSQYVILAGRGDILDFARSTNLKGGVVVLLSAEAPGESEESESVEDTWLKALGYVTYRLRVSGHYYPFELKAILDVIRPKRVIPVHTEVPHLVCEQAKALGYDCLSGGG